MNKETAINYLVQKRNEILTCDAEVWKAAIMSQLPHLFPLSGSEKKEWFEEKVFDSYIVSPDQELYPMWERKQAQGYLQNFIDEIEQNDIESGKSRMASNEKIATLIQNEFFYIAVVFIGGLCFFLGTFYEKTNHPQIKYKQPKTEIKQKLY